jgi:hypothetical protein
MIRTRILEAIASDPDAVIAVATDAVYSTRPLELPISSALGDWETHAYVRGFWAQTGVYALWPVDGPPKLKSRGFREKTWGEAIDGVIEHWLDGTETFQISETQFVNIKAALVRNDYEEIVGQWIERKLDMTLLPQAKRAAVDRQPGNTYLTLPTLPGDIIRRTSHPYAHKTRWQAITPTTPNSTM